MWTRKGIKDYAKNFLRDHYWKAFLVCLIASLLGGGGGSNTDVRDDNQYIKDSGIVQIYEESVQTASVSDSIINKRIKSPLYYLTGGVLSTIMIIIAILIITLGFNIEVGKNKFFLNGFKGDVRIRNMFSTFNMRDYFPIIRTQFLRGVYQFLWLLLFIVPGIIKFYEYRFVPYILAEESDLPSNDVISMSREMTYGHKWDMFVFDLSFIGWYILGTLALGVGVLFVNPYKEAANARLYNVIYNNIDPEYDGYHYNVTF